MRNKAFTRRGFLKRSLLAGTAFTIIPRAVLGGNGYTAPSDKLTRAIIGVGGMGKNHIKYPGAELLAICDVDEKHLLSALKLTGPGVKTYTDFRELLARPDIDIVHIVTPPHWHALMSIAAAEAGKDIWCEKPMTRTIGEGEKVVETVQHHGRMFRLNTWFRFHDMFYGFGTPVQPIKKLVDSGLLGWPIKVTVNRYTGFDWKLDSWSGRTNLTPQSPPNHLNYDMWLGPAPVKPYHPLRVHESFRGYWDYDGGGLGDMAQHYLDPVQYFLGKDRESPIAVEADTPQQHPDAVIPWRRIEIKYTDGCQILLDGENKEKDVPYLQGPNGKLYPGFRSDIPDLKEKLAAFPDAQPQLGDFHESVRTRKPFALNETNGHRSCTIINICKIALRLRRPLRFNSPSQRFVDDDQANRLIHQPMRAPWYL